MTRRVEAVYRLSESQRGMLLETVRPHEPGLYVEQVVCTLQGSVDHAAIGAAWRAVLRRHPILRAAFLWKEQSEPLQAVMNECQLPCVTEDWRRWSPSEQQSMLQDYIDRDRTAEFDVGRPPLLRIALFQLADDEYVMVLTFHHLLMDGWSYQVLLADLLRAYAGEHIADEQGCTFYDFLDWLDHHDRGPDESYWQDVLCGLAQPTSVGRPAAPSGIEPGIAGQKRGVSASLTVDLRNRCAEAGVSLPSLVQAAWALLLHRYTGDPDVVFGLTVSGRPEDLPGADQGVGMFVATLPIRLAAPPPKSPFWPWVRVVQAACMSAQQHQFASATELRSYSAVPGWTPLFESLLVIEGGRDDAPVRGGGLHLTFRPELSNGSRTRYPVTLLVGAGHSIELDLLYDRSRLSDVDSARVLDHLLELLAAAARQPDVSLGELLDLSVTETPRFHDTAGTDTSPTAARPLAATSPLTELLVGICAEALNAPNLRADVSLLDYGGHSLGLMQVAARIREAFGVSLPLRDLFESTSVAALAGRVERRLLNGADVLDDPGRRPYLAGEPEPLSPGQRRLWFLSQLLGDSPAYNVYLTLRFRGELDRAALGQALSELVRRHEVLRTVFRDLGGEPVSQVVPPTQIDLELIDIRDEDVDEAVVESVVRELIRRPIHLDGPGLNRYSLIRLAEDDHVFVWSTHHIVADGESLGVFSRDLGEYYEAVVQGREPRLSELPLRYADFAAWQRDAQSSGVHDKQLAYWREQLDGELPVVDLPSDRPRPAQANYEGRRLTLRLDDDVTAAVRDFSRRSGASIFMTMMAALQTLVYRLTDQRDVIIGTPIANRSRGEVDELVGFFLNTLAIRSRIRDEQGFAELVTQVRETALDAYANQDVAFDRVIEAIAPSRDAHRNPLYQVMLVQHVAPAEGQGSWSSVSCEELAVGNNTSQLDLTVYLIDGPAGLDLEVEYSSDLFDDSSAQRMLDQLVQVLRVGTTSPDQPLAALPLLNEKARAEVLSWSRPGPPLPDAGMLTIPDLVAVQSGTSPDAPAVVESDSGEVLSYAELDRASANLADLLVRSGVAPEQRIAVLLPRSTHLVVAMLGVLRSGATCVPIDVNYPVARREAMLRDSGSELVVTSASLSDLSNGMLRTILIERDIDWTQACTAVATLATPLPDAMAFLFYTSGTTGRPKGVATSHAAVARYLRTMHEDCALTSEDRVLQLASPSFDASVRDIFGPLTVGAQVVLMSHENVRDPERVLGAIRAHRISALLSTVPSFLASLTALETLSVSPGDSVRIIATSGEALTAATARRTRSLFGSNIVLVNQYGPTETTMTSTRHVVEPAPDGSAVSLGVPNAGVEIYVLDGRMECVPPGAQGEIFVGGQLVSRGYWNRPADTARSFVPSPFARVPGERLYRTGDLGRWGQEGKLHYIGRTDQQIKIRGVRVEPGEIESVLLDHPAVADAAVVWQTLGRGDGRLIGYVVSTGAASVENTALRAHLHERLPDYMVPAVILVLPELPRNANGKLDRTRLSVPEETDGVAGKLKEAPRDQMELRMLPVWEKVLNRSLGVEDDFFELGGHSLMAVVLVDRVRKEFNVELALTALYQAPTVSQLCDRIRGRARPSDTLVRLPGGPADAEVPIFLVHPQSGEVISYIDLTRELGDAALVYGLGAVGYDTDDSPLRTVEEMAERYLEQVRAVQMSGPYRLGGWSFGANVAYEMARRLEASGEKVDFLLVLDARVFGEDELEQWYQEQPDLVKFGLLAGVDPADLDGVPDDIGLELLLARTDGVLGGDWLSQVEQTEAMRRMVEVFTANGHAADHYRPCGQVDADIFLFRARDRHRSLPTPPVRAEAWRQLTCGKLVERSVAGTHHDFMFPPSVADLGRQVRDVLADRPGSGR
ncbi:amino acid adenylation domain-containing protein [Streptomyces sp. NPDC051218]|uniref:amino acid adenylation domain-containing protein n=1 Tax=Streptomyces sp. NPDC051218 TaxID=3365645 RepID=UPI003789D051